MTKASWNDVEKERRRDEMPDLPYDDIRKVMARIGETADGKLLIAWLHDKVLMTQPPRLLDDSALREAVAEKRFAHRLHSLLEQHIAATDDPGSNTSRRPGARS